MGQGCSAQWGVVNPRQKGGPKKPTPGATLEGAPQNYSPLRRKSVSCQGYFHSVIHSHYARKCEVINQIPRLKSVHGYVEVYLRFNLAWCGTA